jgi:tetratricopeptide (TPR) repeat protein
MAVIRLLTIGLVLLVSVPAMAQAPRRPAIPERESADKTQLGSIKGRVVLESGAAITQAVRVTVLTLRGTLANLFTDNDGRFEIKGLVPGEYSLEIQGDPLGFEVSSEHVEVRRGSPTIVTITLKKKSANSTTRQPSSSASVSELSNDVPPKARKHFDRASALSKEGKVAEAIDKLRKAIEIYPNFMMAHNDLGALLMEQGQLDQAILEFLRAIQIDPKAFNPNLNLGIAYVQQRQFNDAADVLRKATSLDSSSAAARLYWGIALKALNDFSAAERELRAAYNLGGATYAEALFHLGEIYMNRAERTLALQAFELYLRYLPGGPNAGRARQMVNILR